MAAGPKAGAVDPIKRVLPAAAPVAAACGALLLCGLLMLGFAGPARAFGDHDTCDGTVESVLTRLGLGDDVVQSIYVSPRRRSSRRGDRITGLDVWVRLKGCAGALVLDLTRHCSVKQIYTRGDCSVPGVASY